MRHTQLAIGIGMLLGVVACLAMADGYVNAQSARNGVRVELGSVGGGGLAGRAFLPIAPRAVRAEVLEGTPCAGMRLVGSGELPHGPVRRIDVSLVLNETGREGRIGVGACPGGTLALTLEDGARVDLDDGELDVTSIDLETGLVEARVTGTGVRGGEPVTVSADIRLEWRPRG